MSDRGFVSQRYLDQAVAAKTRAEETHTVDIGCAHPTHAGPESTCPLCHPGLLLSEPGPESEVCPRCHLLACARWCIDLDLAEIDASPNTGPKKYA